MSKLFLAKIDVKKIKKEKLFTGEKGVYLDLVVWISDEPDQFGNTMSLQQSTKEGEDRIYLGNGKEHVKAESKPEVKTEVKTETKEDESFPF